MMSKRANLNIAPAISSRSAPLFPRRTPAIASSTTSICPRSKRTVLLTFCREIDRNLLCSFVQVVGGLQPSLHFLVDILDTYDRDAVSDAVFLGEAAGVDHPLG